MRAVFSSMCMVALLAASTTAQDAPDRLITKHGVELRADEDVFVLFAALNALEYNEETRRKGPPLEAPVFHPLRDKVRNALRQAEKKGVTAGIKKLFDENPAEVETYLEAILAGDKDKLSPEATKLKGKLAALDKFRNEAELVELFDEIAEEQRLLGAGLKKNLEADFDAAEKTIGGSVRAPLSVVVVVNPLDGHDIVRRVTAGETTYLVVGPGLEAAQSTILGNSLRQALAKFVKDGWSNARKFKAHWDGLKSSSRVGRLYRDDETYFTASLANAMVYHVRAGKTRNKEKDEDFIDQQSNEGMRWARAALRVLDDSKGQMATELAKALSKASP
jgi:hypothetical protein